MVYQKNSSFSDYLNNHLLQYSSAKVAASRGVEWYSKYISVIYLNKNVFSNAHVLSQSQVNEPMSDFLSNVLSDNEVCLESGMLILFSPIGSLNPERHRILPSQKFIPPESEDTPNPTGDHIHTRFLLVGQRH